ncbi:MAG TPA: NADH-quinone oxidoreductase subunit I [candidate division Zixibacteria bacterium]|nr:NADH-quinone oxidoreductase subunit I [candidate division Zixibacteria bacterium]
MIEYIKGFIELIKGLGITGKHLGMHAVTLQYPEEKDVMPERSRGVVVLLSDKEDGSLNCTACELCMRACPTAAIKIVAPRGEDKKKKLEVFEIDFALCCYCGLCEEACNFSALKLTGKYEYSTGNKDDVLWDVHKLQDVGRDVDYIDKRKKKVKKAAPKPTETAESKPANAKVETVKKESTAPKTVNAPTEDKPKTEGEA